MPANHKVSVAWQIVATFVPILDLWAFYRIKKLRRYVLYVFVPSIVLASAFMIYIDYINRADDMIGLAYRSDRSLAYAATTGFGIGLQGFAIYMAIVWSRQHNRNFDQTMQP